MDRPGPAHAAPRTLRASETHRATSRHERPIGVSRSAPRQSDRPCVECDSGSNWTLRACIHPDSPATQPAKLALSMSFYAKQREHGPGAPPPGHCTVYPGPTLSASSAAATSSRSRRRSPPSESSHILYNTITIPAGCISMNDGGKGQVDVLNSLCICC